MSTRQIHVVIQGDSRRLRSQLLRGQIRTTRSRVRRFALRLEWWRVRYSLWREPPAQGTGKEPRG